MSPELGQLLRRIRDGETKLDELIEDVRDENIQELQPPLDFLEHYVQEKFIEESDLDPDAERMVCQPELWFEEYRARRDSVAFIVGSRPLPTELALQFQRVRRCFAYGEFEAAVILCRSVIEGTASRAIRSRRSQRAEGTPDSLAWMLQELGRIPGKFGNRTLLGWCNRVKPTIDLANGIVHMKEGRTALDEATTLGAILRTREFVEDLFP